MQQLRSRRGSLTAAAVLAVTTLAFAPVPAAAQQDPLAGFDAYVRQAVQDWGAVGLAVAVVKDGETVFAKGYGVRDVETGEPVDEHTRFAIGSTTKALTAAAVGMLVDEGKLDWDDPVIDHLPWFRLSDPVLTREVTVRDLLTHNAGLPNADYLWAGQDADPRDILERLRYVEPVYSLRSDFIYQNMMYAVAGAVIEAVSGRSWADFVRERIFRPLEMAETVPLLAETVGRPNVAEPHDLVDGEVVRVENSSVDAVAAAGSAWSSVHDMARWLGFLLRDCVTEDGRRLLEPETCEELFTPQTILREPMYPAQRLVDPNWTTYGLAWFQQDYEGRKMDFHTGSINGMVAIAGMIRDEGIGVYVLANRDHVEVRHALMYRVLDLYDDEPPRDWSAELLAVYADLREQGEAAQRRFREARVEGTEPSLPLARYAGTYDDPLYGTVRVEVDPASGLRATYGLRAGPLEHWHYDTFRASWEGVGRGGMTLTFEVDASGSVAALRAGSRRFERAEGR